MTAVERLREAARVLREQAARLPERWLIEIVYDEPAEFARMAPPVALALADWLDLMAALPYPQTRAAVENAAWARPPLAVADAILGGVR